MATRRSRRSSGLGAVEHDELAEFDTFRRRHARQNRDIIAENITRKGLIRSLQDQVASLQAELLSAQRQNAALTRELATLRDTSGALDAIIAAVPHLIRLRGTLVPAPRRARRSMHAAPRAAASGPPPLGVLPEVDEDTPRRYSHASQASTDSFASPSPRRTPRRRRRRESGLFPPQLAATPEPHDEEEVEAVVTPVKQIKKSPVAVESTTPKASPRRRRRSPRKSPRASTTPVTSPLTPAPEEPGATTLPSPPPKPIISSAPSFSSAASALAAAFSPSSTVTSASDNAGVAPAAAPDTHDAEEPPDPPSLASSTSSVTPTSPTESAPEDGRARRARSSVSYKEPSLRTKMRKPDGVSSEEALGLRPRGSMLEGVRRKSALPRSTAKLDFRVEKDEEAPIPEPKPKSPTNPITTTAPLAPSRIVKEAPLKEGSKKAPVKRRSNAIATTGATGATGAK
ncbi:hypothetical protein CC85DRAFT_283814, partial [Cutaneotrichosporon oleaginosum]